MEGKEMQALAQAHMRNHQLSHRQFLRAAYMWKFNKDISDLSLANDCKLLVECGRVPQYLTDYLVHIYGASSCK